MIPKQLSFCSEGLPLESAFAVDHKDVFLHILGSSKHIFNDLVRLIMCFYSQSEYNKPLEC